MDKTSHLTDLAGDRWSPSVGSFPLQARLEVNFSDGAWERGYPISCSPQCSWGGLVSQNASYACSVLFYVTTVYAFEPGDVIVHACTTKTNHRYDVQWLLPTVRELCTETSFWRREYFQLKIDLMTCVQVVQMTLCVMACVQWSLYNVCVHYNNNAVELWLDTWEPPTKWSQHVALNF